MWQGINITGFKGNKPATVNIASSLPDEINNFYARFEAHSQHRPHRECSRGCCRRGQSTLHFCRECNPILQMGEYPQSCGSGWNTRPCAQTMHGTPLTPILSKCFEKLIRDYICSVLPDSLDPLQFAYRSNRSTDDAIAFNLHTALSHLENKNTYVRMLFVDYSSAFNTILPATLVAKLQTLGLIRSLCSWIWTS